MPANDVVPIFAQKIKHVAAAIRLAAQKYNNKRPSRRVGEVSMSKVRAFDADVMSELTRLDRSFYRLLHIHAANRELPRRTTRFLQDGFVAGVSSWTVYHGEGTEQFIPSNQTEAGQQGETFGIWKHFKRHGYNRYQQPNSKAAAVCVSY